MHYKVTIRQQRLYFLAHFSWCSSELEIQLSTFRGLLQRLGELQTKEKKDD
jgi:hypothetical protein